jgi:NTE family protein
LPITSELEKSRQVLLELEAANLLIIPPDKMYLHQVPRLTLETINKLIKEGKCDTWFSIIEKGINDLRLDDHNKHILISELDIVWQKLREKDYEDNDSYVYHLLTNFIENVQNKQKLEPYQSDKLVKPARSILAILN